MQDNETLNDRIRVFEVKDQGSYFARIMNPRLYSEVTKDVICRKAYPLVIDKYRIDSKANYQYKMLNTYIDETSTVSISANVQSNCVIGMKSKIDQNT